MDNTVAVIMPKGGTGKTTTTVNLAGAMVQLGHKVLVVDNDWQGSASVHFGIKDPDAVTGGLADLLAGKVTLRQAIHHLPNGIDLVPGNGELANADLLLLGMGEAGVYRLREALEPATTRYDVVLIDSEPGMQVRNLGALAAADYLLVPVSADYLSVKPLQLFLRVLSAAGRRYQFPEHRVALLVTRFDARQHQAWEVVDILKKLAPAAGMEFFELIVPERAMHRRVAAAGEPVTWAESTVGRQLSALYRDLAERVMAW